MRGIFFRSDTRHPTNDGIFEHGFSQRDGDAELAWNVRGPQMAKDVDANTAVCLTKDFYAAALFPVSELEGDSWIYVLDLDVANIVNAQAAQYEEVRSNGWNTPELGMQALWPMFGQERCAKKIDGGDIVGAVKIHRTLAQGGAMNGGSFRCLKYQSNSHYTGAQKAAVRSAMKAFVSPNASYPMPTSASGLVARGDAGRGMPEPLPPAAGGHPPRSAAWLRGWRAAQGM